MRYKCRCSNSKCRARKTFAKHPLDYVKTPKCFCGGDYTVDQHRTFNGEHKKVLCTCMGTHYPHRKGSVILCEHSTYEEESDGIPDDYFD